MGTRGAGAARTVADRPRTGRGAATRARIVDAAADLIYERGVAGTSLDMVMEAGGCSRSQLYHYFRDKDALVADVVERQTCRLIEAQEELLAGLDTIDGFRAWRDAVVAFNTERRGRGGCPLGSLAAELADRSEDAHRRAAEGFAAWQARIAAGISAMGARGDLRPGSDPDELATAVMAALQGGLLLARTSRSSEPLSIALDMAIDRIESRLAGARS